MTGGSNKVETSMDSKVDFVNATRLLLLEHVGLMLVIQEFDNGHPGIPVVYVVPESRSVDYRKAYY